MPHFYGPTIRQIRHNKGYLQKEIYTDIVSKSFAILFEKGTHDISVTKFEAILERLNMNYQEFQHIHAQYQTSVEKSFFIQIVDAANKQDLPQLERLEQQLLKNMKLHQPLPAYYFIIIQQTKATSQGLALEQVKEQAFLQTAIQTLSHYLLEVDTWYRHEIGMFSNTLHIFDYDLMLLLLKKSFHTIQAYTYTDTFHQTIGGLLVNALDRIFNEKDWLSFDYYHTQLGNFSLSHEQLFHRIVYQFYIGLRLIVKEKQLEQGHLYAQQAIEMLEVLDQTVFAKRFSLALEQVLV